MSALLRTHAQQQTATILDPLLRRRAKRACKGYASALARSFGSMFTDLRRGTESYPAPEPGAGAGLSGAPPTETGPTGLGSGEIIFSDARTARARVFECGMLEVVNGVTALCRASACAASEER